MRDNYLSGHEPSILIRRRTLKQQGFLVLHDSARYHLHNSGYVHGLAKSVANLSLLTSNE